MTLRSASDKDQIKYWFHPGYWKCSHLEDAAALDEKEQSRKYMRVHVYGHICMAIGIRMYMAVCVYVYMCLYVCVCM